VPLVHWPAVLQVCGVTPEHWVLPGTHTPEQALPEQT
jgi:hypothetical protein